MSRPQPGQGEIYEQRVDREQQHGGHDASKGPVRDAQQQEETGGAQKLKGIGKNVLLLFSPVIPAGYSGNSMSPHEEARVLSPVLHDGGLRTYKTSPDADVDSIARPAEIG